MKINIFLPEKIYELKTNCELFGEIKIDENLISYYIYPTENINSFTRKLGVITDVNPKEFNEHKIVLSYNENNQIFLLSTSIYSFDQIYCNIYIYDHNISVLNAEVKTKLSYSDVFGILGYVSTIRINIQQLILLFIKLVCKPMELFVSSGKIESALKNYSFLKLNSRATEKRDLFDFITGLIVMYFILTMYQHGEYLLDATQEIIYHLRYLLLSLKGNPIGLKLNLHLNNFLLDCFKYHMELWSTFVGTISSFIQVLLIPIAIAGVFGITCQLKLISDLLNLITLHAHCFYIYTTVLFNIEKIGLRTLWKMAIGGQRINSLKNRTQSLEQMNRQWYITMLFLTCIIFLMPTILTYYIVFSSIRFCIYALDWCLLKIRDVINECPVDDYINWLLGCYRKTENIEINFMGAIKKFGATTTAVFRMNLRRSFPISL